MPLDQMLDHTNLIECYSFLQRAVDELSAGGEGCYYFNRYPYRAAIVVGFLDEEICAKIASSQGYMSSDFEYDWTMPIDKETGDVIDTIVGLERLDDKGLRKTARWLLRQLREISDGIQDGSCGF